MIRQKKTKPVYAISTKALNLSFSKIHGIHTNFCSTELFLLEHSPDILVLCETNLKSSISSTAFSVSWLSFSLLKRRIHDLGVYFI